MVFKRFFSLFLLFGVVGVLGGCDTLRHEESSTSEIKVTSASGTPVVDEPLKPQRNVTDQDLKNMTSTFSSGSVEVYDLDGDVHIPKPVPSVQSDYIGIPMATDPRVIVYPLDGDAGSFPVPLGAPQWNKAGYIPPIKNDMMTSAPNNIWGDEVLENDNGVLSPRVDQNSSSVYFHYGSAKLDGANRSALSNIAEIAKFAPVDRVSVEGHASRKTQTPDLVKSKILNLKESMNRVQAVSQKLMEEGVPAEKIKTTAWGDTKPSGAGGAQDRRVDIITGSVGQ